MKQYRLIGLTGSNGAGKGEAAAFLVARGYSYRSLSDIIREKLASVGLAANRDHLIAKGNELRRDRRTRRPGPAAPRQREQPDGHRQHPQPGRSRMPPEGLGFLHG